MHITVKNLSFSFAPEHEPLFQNVSFQLPTQAIHYIRGDNGCGKSTLMRLMAGRTQPNEGTIAGTAPNALVAQDYESMLALNASVKQNLQLAQLSIFPSMIRPLAPLQIHGPLEQVLEPLLEQPTAQLSGGQKQIVAIAMALEKSARVLFLDEPTAALDATNVRFVYTCLHELVRSGLTIIVICHQAQHVVRCGESHVIHITRPPHHVTRHINQHPLS